MQRSDVIVIVGPTASGKSDVAQELALRLDGEIVSADSMQIYRGMDIGTGKLLPDERKVPHWGLDIADPGEPYSAALFQEYARSCFDDIANREKRAILAGGTGFYVRAAVDDFDFPKGEQTSNPVRERYSAMLEREGPSAVWEALNAVDPESASLIHPHNSVRVIRALEMADEGVSYAAQKQRFGHIGEAVASRWYGLRVNPDVLRRRIDMRVDAMMEHGLVDEVKSLLQCGFREGLTANRAIGYKEIVAMLDGEISTEEAVERIKTATHRYAKRQRTWFKADRRIHWLDADEFDAAALANRIMELEQTV